MNQYGSCPFIKIFWLSPKPDIRPVTPVLAIQFLLSLPIAPTLPRLVQLDRRHLVALVMTKWL